MRNPEACKAQLPAAAMGRPAFDPRCRRRVSCQVGMGRTCGPLSLSPVKTLDGLGAFFGVSRHGVDPFVSVEPTEKAVPSLTDRP